MPNTCQVVNDIFEAHAAPQGIRRLEDTLPDLSAPQRRAPQADAMRGREIARRVGEIDSHNED